MTHLKIPDVSGQAIKGDKSIPTQQQLNCIQVQ